MTPYDFGDIVLVMFPFTDQSGSKRRPAVVVSARAFSPNRPDLILLAVTSRITGQPSKFELTLSEWSSAGLPKPSVVKPVALTVHQSVVARTLGRLGANDQSALRELLGQLFLDESR